LRTGTIEKQMADTSGTMRNVQALLNKLAAEQANNAQAQAALEAEIDAYEKNIGIDGRCIVTDRDRQWLLGNAK
jgi:hypothetical protein